jgi:hypothetical protein
MNISPDDAHISSVRGTAYAKLPPQYKREAANVMNIFSMTMTMNLEHFKYVEGFVDLFNKFGWLPANSPKINEMTFLSPEGADKIFSDHQARVIKKKVEREQLRIALSLDRQENISNRLARLIHIFKISEDEESIRGRFINLGIHSKIIDKAFNLYKGMGNSLQTPGETPLYISPEGVIYTDPIILPREINIETQREIAELTK